MSEAELVVTEGRLKGQHIPMKQGQVLSLGRSVKSDIQIPDQGISRLHCRLDFSQDTIRMVDLGSSNGTQVNGITCKESSLIEGDVLAIGSSSMRIQYCKSEPGTNSSTSNKATAVQLVEDASPKHTSVKRKFDRHSATVELKACDNPLLEKAQKSLAAICRMANTIYQEKDLDAILSSTAEAILEVSGADRSAIVMISKTGEIEPVALRTIRPGSDEEDFRVSQTIIEETLNSGVSVISSDAGSDDRFKLGASVVMQNIRSVMCVPLCTESEITGAIYVDSVSATCMFTEAELRLLAAIGQQTGVAIERASLISDLENLFVGSMHTIIASIEAKDAYTRGHSERVTSYALMIGRELGLSNAEMNILELSGLLHDVGKIGVPENVLLKPGKLDKDEFAMIQEHPSHGVRIIENMPEIDRIVSMTAIVQAVKHHHERFDGKGYPSGLTGHEIPLPARILAVADTFDAITSDRPYRKGRDFASAISIITDCSDTQFDPELVEVFNKVNDRGDTARPENVPVRFRIAGSAASSTTAIRN